MAKITVDKVISSCCACYNNMTSKDLWNKVDPQEAQIMALTTQLKELKDNQQKTALATKAQPQQPQKGIFQGNF